MSGSRADIESAGGHTDMKSKKRKPNTAGRMRTGRKNSRDLMLMSLPAIIWYILFCYLPFFGIFFAFKNFTPKPGDSLFRNLFINSRWSGMDNFSFLFRSSEMPRILFNTLFYNGIFLMLGIVIPVFLAIFLAEIHSRFFSGFVQMVMILPYFLSWVIVGYCLYGFLATDEGQLNHVLRMFGASAVQWYQSPQYWRVILILTHIWKVTGYSMIIYLCAITSIDRTLYEGARIDGASFLQRVRYITLPMLRPTIATIFILQTGSILASDFGLFYQVPRNQGMLYPVTDTIDTYVFRSLLKNGNIGLSSAAAFYQSVVCFITIMIFNGIMNKVSKEDALF